EPEPCYNQSFGDNDYPNDSPGVTPHIDHHYCYKCGDSLDDFFCHQCTFLTKLNTVNQPLNIQNKPNNHELFINELIRQKLQKENVNAQLFLAIAITLDLPTVEPKDSLIMGDEHLDTIPEKESDEFIKSSVDYLVPNPSESKDECECNVPNCDDSQTINFSTFSNPLFDDSTSSDDKLSHEEAIHEMSLKTYSNHLLYLGEEIISSESNPIHNEDLDSTLKNNRFDTESYLLESLLNRDTLMASSPKIDSLLDEFAGKLILLKSIPPGIDNADCDPEEEIRLIEKLLYDNSSPRPPKEFISKNSDAAIESFSPSPIPVEDNNSFMEEIGLSFTPDDSMPLGIEDDDYDSEGDILILEEFLSNNSLSLPENESFHVEISSSPRLPAKPPDDDEIEPNSRILTVKVDPGENSSQSPPHIDHHCCYGCGHSLDGIFCQRCTCESCGNGAHIGYNCPLKVLIISNMKQCCNQNIDEFPQTLPSFHPTCYSGDENSFTYDSNLNFMDDSPNPPPQPLMYSYEFCGNDAHYGHDYLQQRMNDSMIELRETFQAWLQQRQEQVVNLVSYSTKPSQCRKIPIYYDDDDDKESSIPFRDIIISELPLCIAITPVLSTEEPVDSLTMKDEHLDTIPTTESDEVIKSSVEDLVPIPSDSEGIYNDTCDVPSCDNSPPLDVLNNHFEIFSNFNDDCTSSNDDSFEDIDYIKASPLDSEPVSLEESPSPFPIPVKDNDSFFEKSDISLSYLDNSLPKFKTFNDHTKETSSGSTTTHADNSLLEYNSFLFEIKPDQGKLTSVVIKDNLGEPRVHVPNVLPTHPTLMLDSDFIPSDDSLGSDFEVSFPSVTRYKIFDPGLFFEV
nr:hypothetical protein [Tanacetum cinerariifolium]